MRLREAGLIEFHSEFHFEFHFLGETNYVARTLDRGSGAPIAVWGSGDSGA